MKATTEIAASQAFKAIAFAYATVFVLYGCTLRLQVALFNHSERPVAVDVGKDIFKLEVGQSATFSYPGRTEAWSLRLAAGNCDYIYQVPHSLDHYPWRVGSQNQLKVQVEKDFAIYLLPDDATGVATEGGPAALQVDGFPLHPESSACR